MWKRFLEQPSIRLFNSTYYLYTNNTYRTYQWTDPPTKNREWVLSGPFPTEDLISGNEYVTNQDLKNWAEFKEFFKRRADLIEKQVKMFTRCYLEKFVEVIGYVTDGKQFIPKMTGMEITKIAEYFGQFSDLWVRDQSGLQSSCSSFWCGTLS